MCLSICENQPVKLDAAGLTWFNNLKNQYRTLPPAQTGASAAQIATGKLIDEVLAKKPGDLVIQDMFDLEDLLLSLLSGPALVTRLKSLRDDYQDVFGKDAWDKIQPSLLPVIDPAKEVENLAEARRLQEELHWQASIRPWASHTREQMMLATLGVTVLVLVAAFIAAFLGEMKFVSALIFAGVLGGAVSSIQRIQSANLASSRSLMLARYSTLKLGVVISPLLGGIFAVLLALMLMSKTVAPGTVVPNVWLGCVKGGSSVRESEPAVDTGPQTARWHHAEGASTNTLAGMMRETNVPLVAVAATNLPANSSTNAPENPAAATSRRPFQMEKMEECHFAFFTKQVTFASGQDLALFILWMFAAGFFERLVPDLLTKIADSKKP